MIEKSNNEFRFIYTLSIDQSNLSPLCLINHMRAFLKSGCTNLSITEELSKLIQDYNFSLEAFKKDIFIEVFNNALKKFEKHIDKHSGLELFKTIRFFDPSRNHQTKYTFIYRNFGIQK